VRTRRFLNRRTCRNSACRNRNCRNNACRNRNRHWEPPPHVNMIIWHQNYVNGSNEYLTSTLIEYLIHHKHCLKILCKSKHFSGRYKRKCGCFFWNTVYVYETVSGRLWTWQNHFIYTAMFFLKNITRGTVLFIWFIAAKPQPEIGSNFDVEYAPTKQTVTEDHINEHLLIQCYSHV